MARVLLIDDDRDFAHPLRNQLGGCGHDVRWLDLAEEGLNLLTAGEVFDVVLLDNRMPRMSGLEFLAALKQSDVDVPVILMTGAHNDSTAIQATNLGAFTYVIKPVDESQYLSELQPALSDALKITRRPRPVPIPHQPAAEEDASLIVGRSRAILEALMSVGRFAEMDETVLILGETGTGKDLFARAIHTNSRRKDRPFVVMNCGSFKEGGLGDDELFGHEIGAFTGATKLRKGLFEHAHGGTVFLDEVGEMPPAVQIKLLRVLENHEVKRAGSNELIKVDVRVLAATHRDLPALVRAGTFREDVFYRLGGLTLPLPPLRERREDIDLLARLFLARMFAGSPGPSLSAEALKQLREHTWLGNVRQLQKVLCRAAGVCHGSLIVPKDLDFGDLASRPAAATCNDEESALAGLRGLIDWAWKTQRSHLWPLLQERLECELLRFALAQKPGLSQVQLARRLGIVRNTLRDRLKKYELQGPSLES